MPVDPTAPFQKDIDRILQTARHMPLPGIPARGVGRLIARLTSQISDEERSAALYAQMADEAAALGLDQTRIVNRLRQIARDERAHLTDLLQMRAILEAHR